MQTEEAIILFRNRLKSFESSRVPNKKKLYCNTTVKTSRNSVTTDFP